MSVQNAGRGSDGSGDFNRDKTPGESFLPIVRLPQSPSERGIQTRGIRRLLPTPMAPVVPERMWHEDSRYPPPASWNVALQNPRAVSWSGERYYQSAAPEPVLVHQTSGSTPTVRGKATGPVLAGDRAPEGIRKGEVDGQAVGHDEVLEAARTLLQMVDGMIESRRGKIEEGRRSSQP